MPTVKLAVSPEVIIKPDPPITSPTDAILVTSPEITQDVKNSINLSYATRKVHSDDIIDKDKDMVSPAIDAFAIDLSVDIPLTNVTNYDISPSHDSASGLSSKAVTQS